MARVGVALLLISSLLEPSDSGSKKWVRSVTKQPDSDKCIGGGVLGWGVLSILVPWYIVHGAGNQMGGQNEKQMHRRLHKIIIIQQRVSKEPSWSYRILVKSKFDSPTR